MEDNGLFPLMGDLKNLCSNHQKIKHLKIVSSPNFHQNITKQNQILGYRWGILLNRQKPTNPDFAFLVFSQKVQENE